MHVLARAAKRRIGAPVPRLDDQRIAVPTAARAAAPLADLVRRKRPPVERDDPRLVHHLVDDQHVVVGLHELVVVVVAAGQHRRTRRRVVDAARRETLRLGTVGGRTRLRREPLFRRFRELRNLGRSAGPRSATCAAYAPRQLPESHQKSLYASRMSASASSGRESRFVGFDALGLVLARFLFREKGFVREIGGPLERRHEGVRPQALQVRLTGRQPGRRVVGGIERARAPARRRARQRVPRSTSPLTVQRSISWQLSEPLLSE